MAHSCSTFKWDKYSLNPSRDGLEVEAWTDNFLGDLLRLNLLIFFVNYFCLQNELFMLMAIFCLRWWIGYWVSSYMTFN